MKKLSLWGLLGALALSLGAGARPAAAAEIKAIAQAVGDRDPYVLSWVDTAEGKLSIDETVAEQIHAMFAGVQYLITDQQSLLLGRLEGQELKLIVPPVAEVHNPAQTFFAAHVRSQDKTLFLDGTLHRSKEAPSEGFAQFNLLMIAKDGSTISALIQQDLTFRSQTQTQ